MTEAWLITPAYRHQEALEPLRSLLLLFVMTSQPRPGIFRGTSSSAVRAVVLCKYCLLQALYPLRQIKSLAAVQGRGIIARTRQ